MAAAVVLLVASCKGSLAISRVPVSWAFRYKSTDQTGLKEIEDTCGKRARDRERWRERGRDERKEMDTRIQDGGDRFVGRCSSINDGWVIHVLSFDRLNPGIPLNCGIFMGCWHCIRTSREGQAKSRVPSLHMCCVCLFVSTTWSVLWQGVLIVEGEREWPTFFFYCCGNSLVLSIGGARGRERALPENIVEIKR
ncbi:hypothetical protein IF2G_08328 [Cordyceps javanica]|nr:hypothetical protein IF2G_08328 [Cordyceps javanica]